MDTSSLMSSVLGSIRYLSPLKVGLRAAMLGVILGGALCSAAVGSELSREPFSRKSDALMLRSRDVHGGGYEWQMVRQVEGVGGADVSRVGFRADAGLKAVVPGTVLNSLVYNGVYPEPYYGLNNAREKKLIPDITEVGSAFYTYWFRTEFELTPAFAGKWVILRVDGINYRAQIWVNGREVGAMAGMFNRGFFDVTDVVKYEGANGLAVLVKPVDVPGGFLNKFKEVRAVGENKNGGDGQFGKNVTMLMSVGWDFTFSDGIRDRNTGIWKDITLFAVDAVELRDAFVKSELSVPDLTISRQTITVEVINHTAGVQAGSLKAAILDAGVTIEKRLELAAGESRTVTFGPEEYLELVFKNPRLWWPMNKGPQHLYGLTLTFERGGKVCDTETVRFAVRHVSSDQNTPDRSRQFYINGKPIFLHGTNWIPEAMLRNSEARTYTELRNTRQAGINFMRFWAGGIVESDYFFDLCDELGIMVSMEFWQSGDTVLPEDRELYRTNAADTIKLLRNHPSLVYYISANERDAKGIVPIKDLVDALDGTRGWQAGSEIDGIHDGSPYKYVNPMFYYDDSASSRGSRINGLCPEYGTPCLPTLDCLKEMMDEKDIWPVNKDVWDYHDGGGFHDMVLRYVPAIQEYGPVETAEELAWKGQMVGAVGYRGIWECWTYNRQDCGDRFTTGVWFWYHNSPTRQVCGRMWDWSLEPTAALYYSQDAHEPIHAQYDFIKNTVSVNNELYEPFKGAVSIRIFDLDMKLRYEKSCEVYIREDKVANDVMEVVLPEDLSAVHFIRLDVKDRDDKAVADTFYWRSTQAYKGKNTYTGPLYGGFGDIEKLPEIGLSAKVKKQDGKYVVSLKNPSESLAFMIQVKLADGKTSKPVRPTFYTDNFFSLLPGEEKVVEVEPYERGGAGYTMIIDGWNIKAQSITISD
ncbi:MAG: sugar-binding domain-containing protein [Anaerohalosphaeraceae bacterium]